MWNDGVTPASSAPSGPVELENQFVIRLPPEPATALREAVKSGVTNLKDRLKIQLEPDKQVAANTSGAQLLRRGTVVFDGWRMKAKLMDLPTILESMKTIDGGKTVYKTADVAQLLVCKECDDTNNHSSDSEEMTEESNPKALEKRYHFKHGICPPLKNCRRRRFRKTLKKKFVEAPEVEKEVKQLLRIDNEAVEVKYEVITEEELHAKSTTSKLNPGSTNTTVDEEDLFGVLSDSDDENKGDMDATTNSSRSQLDESISASTANVKGERKEKLVTSFSKEMFTEPKESKKDDAVRVRVDQLKLDVESLQTKRMELQRNITNCDNQALLKRFEEALSDVNKDLDIKKAELEDLSMLF